MVYRHLDMWSELYLQPPHTDMVYRHLDMWNELYLQPPHTDTVCRHLWNELYLQPETYKIENEGQVNNY